MFPSPINTAQNEILGNLYKEKSRAGWLYLAKLLQSEGVLFHFQCPSTTALSQWVLLVRILKQNLIIEFSSAEKYCWLILLCIL